MRPTTAHLQWLIIPALGIMAVATMITARQLIDDAHPFLPGIISAALIAIWISLLSRNRHRGAAGPSNRARLSLYAAMIGMAVAGIGFAIAALMSATG